MTKIHINVVEPPLKLIFSCRSYTHHGVKVTFAHFKGSCFVSVEVLIVQCIISYSRQGTFHINNNLATDVILTNCAPVRAFLITPFSLSIFSFVKDTVMLVEWTRKPRKLNVWLGMNIDFSEWIKNSIYSNNGV